MKQELFCRTVEQSITRENEKERKQEYFDRKQEERKIQGNTILTR